MKIGSFITQSQISFHQPSETKKMKKPLEWGDEISLLALCGLYNVETYVIATSLTHAQPIKPPSWTDSTQRQLRGRLFIGSITDRHYVSTRPIDPLTCV
jgi:hypothetical protein